MKQKKYGIQILNLDTGIKVKHVLQGALLSKRQILQLLQSYNPQIDFQNLVIYYFTRGKWIFLLDNTINLDQYENQWQNKESDQILMRVKYHCYYLLDEEEEKRFNDDVKLMSQKINEVHELYQDLKEKYKQQALDISIFWGSPLFAADKIQRKVMQTMTNSGEQVQLLTNQVKYAPYINAITTALQTCDKKVHLEIDQLNDKSFSQRNIFTVVYLMAHVQIQQSRNESLKTHRKHHHDYRRQRQQKKGKNKKNKSYVQKSVAMKPPNLKETHSQCMPALLLQKPALQKVASTGGEMQMIIEECKNDTNSSNINSSSLSDSTQFLHSSLQYKSSSQQTPKIQIREAQPYYGEIDEQVQYRQYPSHKEGNNKYYFLGEEVNGKLCKISPKKLSEIIKSRTTRNIQLLILHTSFPYQHLEQLRSLANNIILINSNPLVPQPSTIYFMKQLFTHLLQTGNIEQAYQLSLKDLNKLKQISTLMKENPKAAQQEFDKKEKDFVHNINQKYVHGSLDCCCCYHPHHSKCHNHKNKNASKFAQYHYKYHAGQCQCKQQHLMIHTCEAKKTFMKDHFIILGKNYEDEEFYYCCCMGTDLGFYQKPSKNTHLQQLFNINEQKDPHSIKFKYKHEKAMLNQQDNQLQINQGKVTGDWNKQIVNAFKYIQDNPLLGNAPLIIQLFQIFTEQLKHCTIDIIRRSSLCQMYNICNIYGAKSTGRTTIATYFANLMIIKKLCKRIVIKTFNNIATIRNIVQSAQSQQGGRPFFILIHQEKSINKGQKILLNISDYHFGRPASAIIITQHQILADSSLKVHYLQPIPFSNDNCQHYVKKYKHLSFQAKNNIKILFNYAIRGYKQGENVQIYPFSLNQFEILNLVKKTKFESYKAFGEGLDRLDQSYVQYYILIMYIIKFTNSPNRKTSIFFQQIKRYLQQLKQERGLFFKNFNENIKSSSKHQQSSSAISNNQYRGDVSQAYESIINLDQIRDNFYLIFTSIGYKIKDKLDTILKIFINYSSIITSDQFNYNSTIKNRVNYIRIKSTPFSKQVYEATTINEQSYINRYFSKDFEQIYEQYMQNKYPEKTNMHDFERFIMEHASLLLRQKNNLLKRSSYQPQFKSKQRKSNQHHHSLDAIREMQRSFSVPPSAYQIQQQSLDINNIYHLASVIEGGLQFIRNVVCTHFIYNRLNDDEKLNLLKLSMMLINNCIILLKNKKFYDIKQHYDLDDSPQDLRQCNSPQKAYQITHSIHHLDSPQGNRLNRSQQYEFAPSSNNRTYSGKDVMFNQSRQYGISASKSMYNDDDKQSSGPVDQLLQGQLYRLSTHKGLLFLLDQIAKRLQRFSTQNEIVLRTKVCVQLLSIQIRLEQLQVDKQSTKISIKQNNNDRHLNRIGQIFNEKNYNASNIYRILRQQINKNNRFQSDNQQLGLIKSHIVVSLALMASRYGKYKISKSLSQQIDYFVSQWNQHVPLSKRKSLMEQDQKIQTNEFLKTKQNPTQYGFLKSICDHQYVYLHILDAFTSEKYWIKGSRKNHEIQIYQELLAIYHHFSLKNTKTKGDYYAKLQTIFSQLDLFRRKKEFPPLSTYIQNFVEDFIKQVQNQLEKLKTNLIAVFTAEDNRDYVKYSLSEQLQPVLNNILNSNGRQMFNIRKKLNLDTLYDLQSYRGCKFLCIFTSIGQKNSKEQILIQSSQGRPQIIQKERLTQAINSISTQIIFVCLPRKKMLAQSIRKYNNNSKKYIVYFDFDIEHFETFKQSRSGNQEISINDYIVIFQKMIMIATVKELIQRIILRQKDGDFKGFRTPYMAFNDIKNCLSFVLKDKSDRPMIRLTNQQFRNCLFLDGENFQQSKSMQKKQVQFFDIQRVNRFQIESLQKIVKKMSIRKEKMNNERFEQLKIDDFSNVNYFISIFSFYFRDKYGFDNIIDINVGVWRDLLKQSNIVKLFLQKLIQQKILDLIFSTKKVVIILYFDTQSNDKMDHLSSTLKICDSKLWNIITGIDQTDSKRIINKFTGSSNIGKKKVNHAFVYMLQSSQSALEKA